MGKTDYKKAVLELVSERWDDQGEVVLTEAEVVAVADRMLAAVPRKHVYDELVGPFYDTAGLERHLGVSRQAVWDRVKRGTLLRVMTSDNVALYPSFQFDGAAPVKGLGPVLRVLADADGWAVALWLTTEDETLEGVSPVEWLRRGRPIEPVVAAAKDVAARWTAR